MKRIVKTLIVCAVVYGWMWASNDDYLRAVETEQRVASFWDRQ
jgi:hypothetical protein